jgi:hypothetical protein
MTPLETRVTALERMVDEIKATRDRDHAMIVSIFDRQDRDITNLRNALNGLIVNDKERNHAAEVCVTAHHTLVDQVVRLKATVDLFFRSGPIQ